MIVYVKWLDDKRDYVILKNDDNTFKSGTLDHLLKTNAEIQDWLANNGINFIDLSMDNDSATATAVNYAIAKRQRDFDVTQITVTTAAGNTFQGNEDAQTRMARAVTGLNPTETIQWKMADNTMLTVTREELKEALVLAGRAQETIWATV